MFGIGFFEFLLIVLSILIFIRPADLPKFIYRVGKIYGEIRSAYTTIIREINLLSSQAEKMVEDEKQNLKNIMNKSDFKRVSQSPSTSVFERISKESSQSKKKSGTKKAKKTKQVDKSKSVKSVSKKSSTKSTVKATKKKATTSKKEIEKKKPLKKAVKRKK